MNCIFPLATIRFVGRALSFGALALSMSTSATAHAAPVKPPGKEAPPPNPDVALVLTAPAESNSWEVRVENRGDTPIRLVASERLLSFEIKKPNAKKAVRCALPADMRNVSTSDTTIVVAAKKSFRQVIDPRIYCFGATASAALAEGSEVIAHFGWAAPKGARRPAAPFVVSVPSDSPARSPMKELVSAPIVLGKIAPPPRAPAEMNAASESTTFSEAFPVRLSLASSRFAEAYDADDFGITVTLKNEGEGPATLLFAPATLGFDVSGPNGAIRCDWTAGTPAPTREGFRTLRTKGTTSLSIEVSAYCPERTFDQAGLYAVRARLDSRNASGKEIGIRSFDGQVTAANATLVRVHKDSRVRIAPLPTAE